MNAALGFEGLGFIRGWDERAAITDRASKHAACAPVAEWVDLGVVQPKLFAKGQRGFDRRASKAPCRSEGIDLKTALASPFVTAAAISPRVQQQHMAGWLGVLLAAGGPCCGQSPTMPASPGLEMPTFMNLYKMLSRRKMGSRQLAERIGIIEQKLSLLKSGKVRGVRFKALAAICVALQCQPGDRLEFATAADAA